jgi:TadE-like protein
MVEFALVGPLFFVLLFGAVNSGLILFSINAADQTANVGVQQLASWGDYLGPPPAGSNLPNPSTADDIALYEMQKIGLDSTGNATVLSYRITKLNGPPALTTYTDAVNCLAPDGCDYLYTVATHSWSGNWPACACGNRNTTSANADFIRLDITYSYQWLFGAGPAIQLTATRVIRLEPQS